MNRARGIYLANPYVRRPVEPLGADQARLPLRRRSDLRRRWRQRREAGAARQGRELGARGRGGPFGRRGGVPSPRDVRARWGLLSVVAVTSPCDRCQPREIVGQALGNVLPLAVAVAIFPVPIIAVVLLLASGHGMRKAVAFVLTWCAGLAAIGAIVLALAGIADANNDGEPATWVSVLLLVLGLLLL